jgi:hypothetical protein
LSLVDIANAEKKIKPEKRTRKKNFFAIFFLQRNLKRSMTNSSESHAKYFSSLTAHLGAGNWKLNCAAYDNRNQPWWTLSIRQGSQNGHFGTKKSYSQLWITLFVTIF